MEIFGRENLRSKEPRQFLNEVSSEDVTWQASSLVKWCGNDQNCVLMSLNLMILTESLNLPPCKVSLCFCSGSWHLAVSELVCSEALRKGQ